MGFYLLHHFISSSGSYNVVYLHIQNVAYVLITGIQTFNCLYPKRNLCIMCTAHDPVVHYLLLPEKYFWTLFSVWLKGHFTSLSVTQRKRKKGHTLLHGESVGSACYLSTQPNLHRGRVYMHGVSVPRGSRFP